MVRIIISLQTLGIPSRAVLTRMRAPIASVLVLLSPKRPNVYGLLNPMGFDFSSGQAGRPQRFGAGGCINVQVSMPCVRENG
jgi:hypothetical protein